VQCGVVVAPGDASALAEAVRELVASPERRSTMAAAGRRAAEEQFDRVAVTEQFVDALEVICR
jgi:colanic acid biosynthesis glycosyl transferase WcaI